jgi:hypothetical protein
MRWLFWDVDFDSLDPDTQTNAILPRVLENGRLQDVRDLLAIYDKERIHAFFREVAHPLISDRTRTFWRPTSERRTSHGRRAGEEEPVASGT